MSVPESYQQVTIVAGLTLLEIFAQKSCSKMYK